MISYVTLGVSDIAAARKFYGDLLGELGAKTLLNMDRITFFGKSMKEPMLAVCIPFNQEAAAPGNGNMVSFQPGSKEKADALYQKAIDLLKKANKVGIQKNQKNIKSYINNFLSLNCVAGSNKRMLSTSSPNNSTLYGFSFPNE